jgi:hypothetical protein
MLEEYEGREHRNISLTRHEDPGEFILTWSLCFCILANHTAVWMSQKIGDDWIGCDENITVRQDYNGQ